MSPDGAPIYQGRLREISDDRVEITFGPSIPRVVWWLSAGAFFCALWRVAAAGGIEARLVVAVGWGVAISTAFSMMQYYSLRHTELIVPRHRLVLRRAQRGTYRGAPEFSAEVDGASVRSSVRRGLFVIRHPEIAIADIVVIGEAAMLLQRFTPRYGRALERAASVALLRAERTSDDEEPLPLSVPPIHAASRVLDLTPQQTGGDVRSSDCLEAHRPLEPAAPRSAFDRWGPLVSGLDFSVQLAWSATMWAFVLPELRRFGGWLAAPLFAVILVAPMVPLFRWMRRVFYAEPLNERVRAMIARANDGPGLASRDETS